eukprot:1932320-Pyramimonas_sp.AAC.1
MSMREHPVSCTTRCRSRVPGITLHSRASTRVMCAVGIAHGPLRKHRIHERPRATCALHKWESLMGPLGAPRPRASTSIL